MHHHKTTFYFVLALASFPDMLSLVTNGCRKRTWAADPDSIHQMLSAFCFCREGQPAACSLEGRGTAWLSALFYGGGAL